MANIPTVDTVKLTAKGLQLLAKVQAGATMYFVRAVIGDGFIQEEQDVADLIEMVHEIQSHQTGTNASSATVDLTKAVVEKDGTVSVRVKIKNGDTAFYMRELGIIAKDPDEGEILYAYINFGDGASAMPAFDGSTYVVRNIQMSFIVSNAEKVEANITLTAEVSYDDFMEHKNATVLDHPDGCVTTEKLANSSVTGVKIKDSAVTLAKLNNDVQTKFDGLEKAIQKLNSTKKIDKCYMYICYNYDSDNVSLICGTTVSGRGPQPPDNYIFSAEISSSSDCGDFEYYRLIQKGDDGNTEIVQ